MIRRNYFIPDETHERLERLSRKTGESMSEHLRRALDEYLAKQEELAKSRKNAWSL